ncbi:MAG: secondary thiamine-phosphate synthase enzyme [Cyanobacteria bacterium QS_8_64_29]|nr:MAG: secondary thiamine-phosphate synthase enzyme [Cyanobacteria bacterium QS_8_64_29]
MLDRNVASSQSKRITPYNSSQSSPQAEGLTFRSETIAFETEDDACIYNVTATVEAVLERNPIREGHVLVFTRHTTTGLAINEDEVRLREDFKRHFAQVAPPEQRYMHNDLHLRDVPDDEPLNAHAHLIAVSLNTSEYVPVMEGELALGKWQSILFFELDGSRQRKLFVQVCGQ